MKKIELSEDDFFTLNSNIGTDGIKLLIKMFKEHGYELTFKGITGEYEY